MVFFRTLALAAVASWTLAACAATPVTPESGAPGPVVLISIDSFRPDYLERGITPNLQRLQREGVHASWMNPSYPSLTFPNHYTLVTGLRPDHHGIVHNLMHDAVLGDFRSSNPAHVGDARWWGGEPLWVTAQGAGLRTATMFWPGSEAPIKGVRPDDWRRYDNHLSPVAEVEQVLQWLQRPAARRPDFITLYFGAVDNAAHDHGPDSPEVDASLRDVDTAIGRLLGGLTQQGLRDRTNLVVVSDHGMAALPYAQTIPVDSLADARDARYTSVGEVIEFEPLPGREAAAEARLLGRHDHYQCWRKQDLPARWHYGSHPRVAPIVCQMDVGWSAMTEQKRAAFQPGAIHGAHGFDPADPSMRALFIAQGPAFRRGVRLPAFDNVDVYPLLARLLAVTPQPNDGDITPLLPALREEPGH